MESICRGRATSARAEVSSFPKRPCTSTEFPRGRGFGSMVAMADTGVNSPQSVREKPGWITQFIAARPFSSIAMRLVLVVLGTGVLGFGMIGGLTALRL